MTTIDLTEWKDKYGWVHLHPNPTYNQSENHPMFHSIIIVLHLKAVQQGKMQYDRKLINNYLYSFQTIYFKDTKEWKLYPEQTEVDFSLDNFTGIISALVMIIRLNPDREAKTIAKYYLKLLPMFHKQLDHPRDFMYVLIIHAHRLLGRFVFLSRIAVIPLLIVWGAHIVTFYQGYKVRKGNRIPKTDGKILAVLRSYSMPWTVGLIFPVLTWLFRNKKHIAYKDSELPWNADVIDKDGDKITWKWGQMEDMFHYFFKNEKHLARFLANVVFKEN